MAFSEWISAARPRTLPLAFSSILMGSALANSSQASFSWSIFGLTILTITLLQILSNYANDLGDYQNGADLADRVGPARAVQSGKITYKQMLNAINVLAVLCLASGIYLLYTAFGSFSNPSFYRFLLIGLACIVAAITYTAGKKPYGYAGLGDISVYIFFGLVGVIGTYYLQNQNFNWWHLLPASSVGFLAVAVLNINNLRDIESDTRAGKKTIPVRFGKAFGITYHKALLLFSVIFNLVYFLNTINNQFYFVHILSVVLLSFSFIQIKKESKPDFIDTFLKKVALSSFVISLAYFIQIIFA